METIFFFKKDIRLASDIFSLIIANFGEWFSGFAWSFIINLKISVHFYFNLVFHVNFFILVLDLEPGFLRCSKDFVLYISSSCFRKLLTTGHSQ